MRSTLPNTKSATAYVRWLLLGSLALNLLFVGAAGAVALRYSERRTVDECGAAQSWSR